MAATVVWMDENERYHGAYVDKQVFTQLLLKILEILGYTKYIYISRYYYD
jgi:hypothetical protein